MMKGNDIVVASCIVITSLCNMFLVHVGLDCYICGGFEWSGTDFVSGTVSVCMSEYTH